MVLTHLVAFLFFTGAATGASQPEPAARRRVAGRPRRRKRWILLDRDDQEQQQELIRAVTRAMPTEPIARHLPVDVLLALADGPAADADGPAADADGPADQKSARRGKLRRKLAALLLMSAI